MEKERREKKKKYRIQTQDLLILTALLQPPDSCIPNRKWVSVDDQELLRKTIHLKRSTISCCSLFIHSFFQLATFSASLNNLMGASRVMEAVAKDILFGPFLAFVARGTVGDNPLAAVLVTWVFVEMFLLMGALNNIAQVKQTIQQKTHDRKCQCQNLVQLTSSSKTNGTLPTMYNMYKSRLMVNQLGNTT